MRADRLLAIMLLLQRGGRMTASDLAERLEVSVRTIYRDLEALGAAGVPVYAEPGRNGGIRILESYTTDLSGLSLAEAELVPLLGLSDAFAGIALGSSLRRTETKLLMALPDDQRVRAEQARRRIHVDLSRWWDHAEPLPHLPTLVQAVFGGRRLRMRYKRGEDASVVDRTLDPLGLVVQGGTWYLVGRAGAGESGRIYRVSRIEDAETSAEPAEVRRRVRPRRVLGGAQGGLPHDALRLPGDGAREAVGAARAALRVHGRRSRGRRLGHRRAARSARAGWPSNACSAWGPGSRSSSRTTCAPGSPTRSDG